MDAPAAQRQEVIRTTLQQSGWESLDFQLIVQRAIANNLLANFDQLRDLIDDFAVYYSWSLNRVAVEPADRVIAELMARKDARIWREHIDEVPSAPPGLSEALAVLRRPPNEAEFLAYAKDINNINAMRRVLTELKQAKPYVLRYETIPASLQWWAEHLAAQSAASQPPPSPQIPPRQQQPAKAASGWGGARIIWYVLILFGVLSRCASQMGQDSGGSAPAKTSYSPSPAAVTSPVAAASPTPGAKPVSAAQRALWQTINTRISQDLHYPARAQRNGDEGTAMVRFELNGSGQIGNAKLLHSSGHQELDDEAVDAVRRLNREPIKPEPGLVPPGGVLVAQLPVVFKLEQPTAR